MIIDSFNNWLNTNDKQIDEAAIDYPQADQYAQRKGLDVKKYPNRDKSELIGGGPIEKTLIDVVSELERTTGLTDFTITSGNDSFHKKYPNSWHNKGLAIDIAGTSLNNSENRKKVEQALIDLMISGKYNKNGMRLGGVNEYDNPTTHATGGHFHISLSNDDPGRDKYESNFAISGITSYSQIRDMKAGKVSEPKKQDKYTVPESDTTKYYKIFDKEQKKSYTLKHDKTEPNVLIILNRRKKEIGKFENVDGKIILTTQQGKRHDFTDKDLGKHVQNLFEKITGKEVKSKPEEEKTVINLEGPGEIKHSFRGGREKTIRALEEIAKTSGITNVESIIGMLCVVGKNTGFVPKTESMKFSPGRLAEKWKVFSKTGKKVDKGSGRYNYNQKAIEYSKNPEKLANYIYGNKNGNTEPNDGWNYRGRGFNNIKYKDQYKIVGNLIGEDLVNDPDLLEDPMIAAKASVAYFLERFKTSPDRELNPNEFDSIDDAIKWFAWADLGWDKNPTNAIKRANKFKNKFKLKDTEENLY